jgi:hypothetical protein
MATTELPLSTDQAAKSSAFIFDVTLSTPIAANGKTEVHALAPKGPSQYRGIRNCAQSFRDFPRCAAFRRR